MDYRDIETFLELVRTRNITKTAQHLYLSQSTISNRLKSLEDELGCQLIVRAKGRRAIQFTRQGEAFIPVAERWKNLFEETELLKSASLSTLRIAVSESTYYEIIAPFLLLFFREHPAYKVSVRICDSELIYDLLEKNLADYGFASYEAVRSGIFSRCISRKPLCVMRWAENPVPGLTIRPGELDPSKEIRFTGGYFSNMRLWREKWFGQAWEGRMEINTSRGVAPFLSGTDYWVLCPVVVAERLAQEMSLQIYRLEEEMDPWEVYLLKNQRNHLENLQVCRVFERELLDYLEDREKHGNTD